MTTPNESTARRDYRGTLNITLNDKDPGAFPQRGSLPTREPEMQQRWEAMDEDHWSDQMALRKPGLVILQFGTNESEDGWFNSDVYEKSVRLVLSRVQSAASGASIMMAAPLDRAEKGDDGRLRSKKVILKLISSQRKVATELGISRGSLYDRIEKSSRIRKAADLSREEIEECAARCGGDLDAMVAVLEVSKRGLQRRMTQLGMS